MQLIDPALSAPAEILAVDEALLDWCETGGSGELLHFWEPREPFVVVGYANKVDTEVNVPACAAAGRPHSDFVTNLPLPAAAVKAAFAKTWHAVPAKLDLPREKITRLAQDKYTTHAWNFKF